MTVAEPLIEEDTTHYPDGDGQPMCESPLHYQWIVLLHANIKDILRDRADALCRADNLIYPVQFEPGVRQGPDVYVALGRAESDRRTYRVWQEDGLFPQIIFEIMSPGNRPGKMKRKFDFYQRYGAEEYYVYDPYRNLLLGWLRNPKTRKLVEIPRMHDHVSPRLGIRFHIRDDDMVVYRPDGSPFLTTDELQDKNRKLEQAARDAERVAREALQKASDADRAVLSERRRADRLAARLRDLGIDPDA
jgi:Uma2 family endonuclease